jgi:putative intracellular protease/amidase
MGTEGARAMGMEDGGGQDQRQGRTLIVVRVVCGGDGGSRGFWAAPQALERWKQLVVAKRVVAAPVAASLSTAGWGVVDGRRDRGRGSPEEGFYST